MAVGLPSTAVRAWYHSACRTPALSILHARSFSTLLGGTLASAARISTHSIGAHGARLVPLAPHVWYPCPSALSAGALPRCVGHHNISDRRRRRSSAHGAMMAPRSRAVLSLQRLTLCIISRVRSLTFLHAGTSRALRLFREGFRSLGGGCRVLQVQVCVHARHCYTLLALPRWFLLNVERRQNDRSSLPMAAD